ncbi:unnamed protein product [Rhizophagus irregularis]|nr:unnamed protein product [Rhizophagus irregularis]
MSNTSDTHSDSNVDDDEDIILKSINCNISVIIAEAEAALNSKVEVTVEMILVEEKECEEQIIKEFGIQTPINGMTKLDNYIKFKGDALGPNAHNKPGKILVQLFTQGMKHPVITYYTTIFLIKWSGLQENYHKYSSRKFFHDLRSQQNKIEMLE